MPIAWDDVNASQNTRNWTHMAMRILRVFDTPLVLDNVLANMMPLLESRSTLPQIRQETFVFPDSFG
jgi:hypothetical protein